MLPFICSVMHKLRSPGVPLFCSTFLFLTHFDILCGLLHVSLVLSCNANISIRSIQASKQNIPLMLTLVFSEDMVDIL